MSNSLYKLAIFCLTAFSLTWGCASVPVEETPGIVRKKPASGRFVRLSRGRYMVSYTQTIPGSEVQFEMVPIPGGTHRMELKDGKHCEVVIEPCWVSKHEVTWGEFEQYRKLYTVFRRFENKKIRPVSDIAHPDAVTIPTPPYDWEYVTPAGRRPFFPVTTVRQFAARQYTKWLSKLTGQLYRLPTETEWEYASLAGANTEYSFGDDPSMLKDYAWFLDNSLDESLNREIYRPVGTRKPNAWGLYDMHGNALEWTLDEYREGWFERFAGKKVAAMDAVCWPTVIYPIVLKGGGFYDAPPQCAVHHRNKSNDPEWLFGDPDYPKSLWWFADDTYAVSVGFRVVRQVNEATEVQKRHFWDAEAADLIEKVKMRVGPDNRGVMGLVDPGLPQAIEQFKNSTDKE